LGRLLPYLYPTNQIQVCSLIRGGAWRERMGALNREGMGMLDGSRYFAEFPDENPDRTPLNPTVLCALVALEREISRLVQTEPETKVETAAGSVDCGSENG
jgi:hypothetical protein